MDYEQVIAPFLDWIANANPQITAQSELATEKEFGPQWSSNPDAQLWFNGHRRTLVTVILAEAADLGMDATLLDKGDDNASTQSGPQTADEGEETKESVEEIQKETESTEQEEELTQETGDLLSE